MPIKAKATRLDEMPCSQCNLLTRADADRCLHCDARLGLSSRARPSPRESVGETARQRNP
jgi:hypothetical protein